VREEVTLDGKSLLLAEELGFAGAHSSRLAGDLAR